MVRVKVLTPVNTIARNNSDLKVVRDFLSLDRFAPEISVSLATNFWHNAHFSLEIALQRLTGREWQVPAQPRPDLQGADVLYQYGLDHGRWKRHSPGTPVIVTTGFAITRQDRERPEKQLQAEASHFAKLLEGAAAIHFHTTCSRLELTRRRPELADRCCTIPFFMPYLSFVEESTLADRYSQSPLRILFVGRQATRKGLPQLCGALDLAAAQLNHAGAQLTVVSPEPPTCRKFTKITHHRSLPREQVQELMRSSHLFAMPSQRDTFGLVFVEAMAAGCVVLADDDLPRQEILGPLAPRLTTDPTRPEEIAQTLIQLVERGPELATIAAQLLQRSRELFAPTPVAQQYAQLFHRVRTQATSAASVSRSDNPTVIGFA